MSPSPPQRIQRRRVRGWRKPPNTVIVTRPSIWGNPFNPKGRSSALRPDKMELWTTYMHESAVFAHGPGFFGLGYDEYALHAPRNTVLVERARAELRGKDLACYCSLGEPCHADVLLEIIYGPIDSKGVPAL